jgi:hypothetical protein
MVTAAQSGAEILSLFVTPGTSYGGARPGRTFPVQVTDSFNIARFPGALQAAFLQVGAAPATNTPPTYQPSDLIAGLVYAVEQGWLSTGYAYGDMQEYVLEQPGFAEASGAAPTLAASGQRLINVCATFDPAPGVAQFRAETIVSSFVGTVGDNTFAPEDLLPGLGYAVAQGWLRPVGHQLVFRLTAAGAAQAA